MGLLILPSPPAADASIRILDLPGRPVRLFLDEEDHRIGNAYLRTPGGTDRIGAVKGLHLAAHAASESDDGSILWKITFVDEAGRSGLHLWIGYASAPSRLWVAESPIAPTLWDTMITRLPFPRGTMPYVAPRTPSYGNLPALAGPETLTFIYTIRLTPNGPAFIPAREVYANLLPLMKRHRDSEFEPIRRLVYTKVAETYGALARGCPPGGAAFGNLRLKSLFTRKWRP